ncbi:MAG: DUF4197 domain-containing protein [Rhodoferax sp.]
MGSCPGQPGYGGAALRAQARRRACLQFVSAAVLGWSLPGGAQGLPERDAAAAVRLALEKGAIAAVQGLGVVDGFWGNGQVRIGLPGLLKDAEPMLRSLGQGERLDALLLAMNRGAERAVPKARTLLLQAVRDMTLEDAQGMVSGGDTAVTQYFAGKTRAALTQSFLPEVARAMQALGVAAQYNQLAAQGAQWGLVRAQDASVERYVTERALDGLYFMIGEEERKIRSTPMEYGSKVLQRVFSGLR